MDKKTFEKIGGKEVNAGHIISSIFKLQFFYFQVRTVKIFVVWKGLIKTEPAI